MYSEIVCKTYLIGDFGGDLNAFDSEQAFTGLHMKPFGQFLLS